MDNNLLLKKNKMPRQPIIGEQIYVPTSLYVYWGQDDFSGGKATINKIEHNDNLPKNHCNYTMVGIKERLGTMYNWSVLLEKQKELKERFGNQISHPDPDIRPEFNDSEADWKVASTGDGTWKGTTR